MNIGKKAGKGAKKLAIKGVKTGAGVTAGLAAETVRAAAVMAATGEYHFSSSMATVAGVATGSNKLFGKGENKLTQLKHEFDMEKDKDATLRKERQEAFRKDKQAQAQLEKDYYNVKDGGRELQNRSDLAEKIAGDGVLSAKENKAVMKYMDKMIDNDYSNMSNEEKQQRLDRINGRNNVDTTGMSDDEKIKWDMRMNDESYRKKATTTSQARKYMDLSKVHGSDKEFENYVIGLGKADEMAAYKNARQSIRDFERAQREK